MNDFELVELEPMPGRRVAIEGELTIGRHECDLMISSPQVSRHHASISADGDGAEITDHGSRNGTFVNDGRVAGAQRLAAGDKVRIGETTWELVAVDAAAPTELESRGDVPAPELTRIPAGLPTMAPPPATPAVAAAPVEEFGGGGGGGRPRASAARRIEATLVCYAVVVLTAIAVVLYLACAEP